MIKKYRWDPEFHLGTGSCQNFSLPPSSDKQSLGLELFDQKYPVTPVCYLCPKVPQGSVGLCASLLFCLREEIEHPRTWTHQFVRHALKTCQTGLISVKIYSGSRRRCCSSLYNICEHGLPSWPFSFSCFSSRPMNLAFWAGDRSKVNRDNRCPILCVLGTAVLEHGWSPEAEESLYPHIPSFLGKYSNCKLNMQNLLVFGEENGMKQIIVCNICECICIYVSAHRFGLWPFFG